MNAAKLLSLAATLVVSTSVWAAPSLKVVNAIPGPRIQEDSGLPTPIRMAKIEGKVQKSWNEKQPDGSFKHMREEVCSISGSIPVYEVSGGTFTLTATTAATCETGLKVGVSTIHIFGGIVLFDGIPDPFNPGALQNWKGFLSGFSVTNQLGTFGKLGSVSIAATEDQSMSSLYQAISSNDLTANASGDIKIDENVEMILHLVD